MGAAGVGVGPDSAKMAGSSANVAAAQRQALQPSETERLQDVLRRRTFQREESAEEKQRREQAAQMGGLTSLQTRVQELVLAHMSAVTPPTAAAYTPDSGKIGVLYPTLTVPDKSELVSILIRHGKGEATSADFVTAARILGITDIAQVGPKLTELLNTTNTEISTAGVAAVGNRLLITEGALTKLGTSSEELAGILGITSAQVLDLTTDELVGQINNLADKEYSRVEALRRIISDPNVGAAERQAAQEQLIGLGYAGVTAAESDIGRLTAELENANTVTINGETLSVSEVLSDTFLSGLIKDYLDNPTGAAAKYINSTSALSGFKSFIDNNKSALTLVTSAMAEDITAFTGIQTTTASLRNNPATGTSLSDQTASDLGIKPTGFVDEVPTPPPVVAYINAGNDRDGAVSTSLDKISKIEGPSDYGGIMAGIRDATQDELQSSGFLDDSDEYASYVTTIHSLNNSSSQSQEQVLESIFGDNFNIPQLEDELKRIRNLQKAGLITDTDSIINLLDSDNDGKLDSPDKLKAAFLGRISKDGRPMTIKEMLAAGTKVSELNNTIKDMVAGRNKLTDTLTDPPDGMTPVQWSSFSKVFSDKESPGILDDIEVSRLGNDTSITYVDLEALSKLPGASKSTALKDLIKTKRTAWVQGIAKTGLDAMRSAPKENRYGSDRTINDMWQAAASSTLSLLNKAYEDASSDIDKSYINSYRTQFIKEQKEKLYWSLKQELNDIERVRRSLRPEANREVELSSGISISGSPRKSRNALRDADRDYDNTIRRYYRYADSLGITGSLGVKHPDSR